jgi:pSer/pThr/pTyr-binding forkhead associated (FHA) protein
MVDEDRIEDSNEMDGEEHPQAGIASEGWSSPQEGLGAEKTQFAELVLKRGNLETEHVFPVNPPAIIGRFDPDRGPIDVDLASLPEGQYVSRRHASIHCDDGAWTLRDLGSSNGTFVLRDDFERIEESPLQAGDEVAFGNARFVFRIRAEEDATG